LDPEPYQPVNPLDKRPGPKVKSYERYRHEQINKMIGNDLFDTSIENISVEKKVAYVKIYNEYL